MLKFYGLEYTSADTGYDKMALVFYTKTCMLQCHGCHNRKLLNGWDYKEENNYKRTNIISVDNSYVSEIPLETIEIELNSGLYDMVILCGGEITIHPLEKIINTIKYIKNINHNILIRIDTNSIFPEKMLILKDMIHGFGCDIKFPYNLYNKGIGQFDILFENIIGLPLETINRLDIPNKMLQGLKIAKELPYTIYRTIKYPFITDNDFFNEIETFAKTELNGNYKLNNFYYI